MPQFRYINIILTKLTSLLVTVITSYYISVIFFIDSNLGYFLLPFLFNKKSLKTFINETLLINSVVIRVIGFYFIFVLYIRSVFMKDNPVIVLWFSLLIIILRLINPDLITLKSLVFIWIYVGVNLIIYDNIGSMISEYLISNPSTLLSTYVMIRVGNPHTNIITRHVYKGSVFAMIVGKTYMSSTGRAAIVTGVITCGGFLYNEHLGRLHDTNQQDLNRLHDATQQDLNRLHDSNQQNLNREVEQQKVDLEQQKLNFEVTKYNDQRATKMVATQAWWSKVFKKP